MANTPIAHVPGSSQPAGTKQPLHTLLLDTNGDPVSVGGGTQYTEDAAAASDPVGTATMLVRTDTPATQVDTDGDNVAQRGTNYGAAYVQVVSSTGSYVDTFGGGTQYTEGDTDTTITGTASLTEGPTNTLTPLQSNAAKDLLVAVNAALPAGTAAIGKLAANSGVDIGDVDVTSVVPGTGATNLGKAEDAAHASGDAGVMLLAVREATATDLSAGGTDGDYEPLQVDATGRLHVNAGTVTVASHAVTNAGTFAVQSTLQTGSNLVGDVGVQPRAANGLATMNATSSDGATALTNTAQVLKATAGLLYGYYIYNPNTAAAYVQFYNTAAASVTVGTTNPLFMLTIPPLAAANLLSPLGITFSNAGWSWAATSTAGGNGALTTALDAVAWKDA